MVEKGRDRLVLFWEQSRVVLFSVIHILACATISTNIKHIVKFNYHFFLRGLGNGDNKTLSMKEAVINLRSGAHSIPHVDC